MVGSVNGVAGMETILAHLRDLTAAAEIPPISSGSAKGRYRNSRTSHAPANFQSRMTLCGETCKTSAVYSTLKLEKPPRQEIRASPARSNWRLEARSMQSANPTRDSEG
jgi:hypothetical protein